MIVNNASSGLTGAQTPVTKEKSMGKDDFMQLLVAQLEHQDPLEPMEGSDFSAQLAQFSALEQMTNMNETLLKIEKGNSQLGASLAVNMIGKQVEAEGNEINLNSSGSSTISFDLPVNASEVKILVHDSSGNYVTTIDRTNQSAGRQEVNWNGKDSYGIKRPEGKYSYSVTALDVDGNEISPTLYTTGTISGIVYENDQVYATIDNRRVPVEYISNIKGKNL